MPKQVEKKGIIQNALSGKTTRRLDVATNAIIEKIKANLFADKGMKKSADEILVEALSLYAKEQSIKL